MNMCAQSVAVLVLLVFLVALFPELLASLVALVAATFAKLMYAMPARLCLWAALSMSADRPPQIPLGFIYAMLAPCVPMGIHWRCSAE
jgi:hypothetical protein